MQRSTFNIGQTGGGQAVGQLASSSLLFKLSGANMNSTADQAMTKQGSFTQYVIDKIIVLNASISLTTAAGGIYTAVAKGGTAIVASTQAYSALTTNNSTLLASIANTDRRTETPILSLTTAQGAAATADFLVYGYAIT